ncbi:MULTISPECIES: PrgI family protein [Enterococcaceae]|uniref:PrgI family protein n=1 Tax=Enterococcaceae TaxID=81852 RepID=UPI000B79AA6B|nr:MULTISPECIES: PrgI family protein [Enterococcus]MCD5019847.1 PrgI family protein [Enterococcus faecium]MDK4378000.1 PrgI family protein [Enterococcus faecium]MDT2357568.1 PrgI family protein [Enterococcus faecium]MDT2456585.1 PrgI family protein [Enterococcus avium]OXC92704.1 PrgI family protein [Enterococcus faecalis]
MVIEVNKDIDRYQESVALGLSAKQLIFSVASVVVGGGMVLLLYRYIGLTGAVYVAIPCVAPIALGGFYSYNGMDFYEYMSRKIHFMIGNQALTYSSTEGESVIKELQMEALGIGQISKWKKPKAVLEYETEVRNTTDSENRKKQEEFEAMKKKTKKILLAGIAVIIAAIAGIAAFKVTH